MNAKENFKMTFIGFIFTISIVFLIPIIFLNFIFSLLNIDNMNYVVFIQGLFLILWLIIMFICLLLGYIIDKKIEKDDKKNE